MARGAKFHSPKCSINRLPGGSGEFHHLQHGVSPRGARRFRRRLGTRRSRRPTYRRIGIQAGVHSAQKEVKVRDKSSFKALMNFLHKLDQDIGRFLYNDANIGPRAQLPELLRDIA